MAAKYVDSQLLIGGPHDGLRVVTDEKRTSLAMPTPGSTEVRHYRRELIAGEKRIFLVWIVDNCTIDDALTKLFTRYPQVRDNG